MSYAEPDPVQLLQWGASRRQATSAYGQGAANLAYQRALAEQQYGNSQYDQGRQWDQYRTKLPGTYAGRGLLNSGIYGQALQNYGVDRSTANARLTQGYQQQLGQYDMAGRNLEQNYGDALASLADQEQARRAALAAQIRGVA